VDPVLIKQYQGIFRDAAIVLVGSFILVYETVWSLAPNWELIAAALTCFGLPPALRIDLRRRGVEEEHDP
jgi:hypothetical protein